MSIQADPESIEKSVNACARCLILSYGSSGKPPESLPIQRRTSANPVRLQSPRHAAQHLFILEGADCAIPLLLDTDVLPQPSEDDLKFRTPGHDESRHYLVSYTSVLSKQPHGMSGAAIWLPDIKESRGPRNFYLRERASMSTERATATFKAQLCRS
jgi:hypothetical protein